MIIKKRRNRERSVSSEKIYRLKELFGFKDAQVSDLLGVSVSHLQKYKACGLMPLDRWVGLKDGLRLHIKQEADDKIALIDSL